MRSQQAEVQVRQLTQAPDLLRLQERFPQQYPFLLDSAGGPKALRRYSLLLRIDADAEPIRAQADHDGFLQQLSQWQAENQLTLPEDFPWPFMGGWFIYLGYELARHIETGLELADPIQSTPDAGAWRCPAAVIIDHHRDSACLIAEQAELLEQMQEEMDQASLHEPESEPASDACLHGLTLSVDDPEHYRQAVKRIKDYILAGDVFQVNLSRAWHGISDRPLDAHELYRRLRRSNPAPFAALCQVDGHWILSSSPERLVEIDDGQVQVRPIAGTRPRSQQESQDAALSEELLLNPKERAEHVMLIDLERNDLGRVCEAGSIEVSELMVIESHAHVHHIVSNVRGRLLADKNASDVIRAVFPGGTITGCPKVRCMEIIAELEPHGRGYYTGSLGYLSRHGHMDLNILIRTLAVRGQRLSFRTGAGIVADSDAQREVDETVAKAHGLCLALGVAGADVQAIPVTSPSAS